MGILDLIFKRKKFKNPATLSFSNIKGFLQGNYRAFIDLTEIINPPMHIREQARWRLDKVKENAPVCFSEGACVQCGCSINEKVYEDRSCEENCYPEMMKKEDWDIYKKENNITFI